MNKFYKRFALLIALITMISLGVIISTVDINTLNNLNNFELWSLIAAISLLSVGLFFDGTRLMHLVRISNEKITFFQAIQVVFGNYFLALLTPGATGGAVAQLLFLRHAGVPTGKATLLVIVRTAISILFLLMCLPVIFLNDDGILPWLTNVNIFSVGLTCLLVIAFFYWAYRKNILRYIIIKLAKKLRYDRRVKFYGFYGDSKRALRLLTSAPRSMLRVFVESGVSLLFIYSVVPVLFMGLGVEADWQQVMGRMIFLNTLLYFAPTPGGSGIAEGGFVLLFNEYLPSGTVGIVAVVWRMIVEYLPFLIGFYYTLKIFGRDFINKYVIK